MPKVLIAEDDSTMVSLLKTLLKMEGFDVVAIAADADVPNAVRTEKPDVVLLDVHLSHQSGLEILDTIRGAKDINGVRVVMSSGANVKECKGRMFKAWSQRIPAQALYAG